jgi:hypothetical protein
MSGSITVVPRPNNPPIVSITTPTNGSVFPPGATIPIQAAASDSDAGGFVTRVDFSVNGNFLSSDNSSPYTASLDNAAEGNYSISAVAVDNQGAVSAPAVVNIAVVLATEAPRILLQPESQTVNAGSNATFSVTAVGIPTPDYQWNFNNMPIAGATSNTLVIVAAQESDEGTYTVLVSNRAGFVLSDPAVLTVTNVPPQVAIVSPPDATGYPFGTPVLLTIQASDTDGGISEVRLILDSELIATFANSPFEITLTDVAEGDHVLSAQATDSGGATSTSALVHFRISNDMTRPTVTITNAPRNFAELTNSIVVIEGTANDDKAVEQVQFQVNGGAFSNAVGTTMWHADVPLYPGNNEVRFRSVDRATNSSALVTRYFTYLVPANLTLSTNGMGSITRGFKSQTLFVGKVYSLTARPAAGWNFVGWQRNGNTNSAPLNQTNTPVLNFLMEPDLELVANFAANPFADQAGNYTGLFCNTNTTDASGFFTLRLDKRGRFTGKLLMNGRGFPFSGQFNAERQALLPVIRPRLAPTVLQLQLGQIDPDRISGSATNLSGTNVVRSDLEANRTTLNVQRFPAPLPIVFRRDDASAEEVGRASVKISPTGSVTFRGTLNDGRKFSASSALDKDGKVPFYVALRGNEVICGWIRFGSEADPSIGGQVFWFRSGADGFVAKLVVEPAM